MRPPNLIVPGFAKAATTSLDVALAASPDVLVASMPAPAIFGRRYDEQLSAMSLFDADRTITAKYVCDRTVNYMVGVDVPERIARHAPDALFVVCVRDPVDRAISHYKFTLSNGNETRSFEDALSQGFALSYLDNSRYGHHVARYLDHFPREQFLFLDVTVDGVETSLASLWSFLAVEPLPAVEHLSLHANQGVALGSIGTRLARSSLLRSLMPNVVKQGLKPLTRKLVGIGPRATLAISGTTRRRLIDLLAPEVDRFEALTGRDVSQWRRSWS